ncbi:hypothetical protein [Acrocarpospora catenulata]|uniref:hypothetical protein n=1 Tax=Acrocarpospora catenulata TaxID=2836182 RepID=UPI002023B38C|nr:hypothetical protein [Acrocarpospora catenulata]
MAEKGLRIAALAAVSLFLTACGTQQPEAQVASAAGASGAAGAAPSPTTSGDALKFAQCMRENGVDIPDPEPGGNRIQLRQKPGNEGQVEKALKACEQYNPIGEGNAAPDPELQDKVLKFAQCMRDNGVDMPDPQVNGGRVRMGGPGMNPDSPTFQKAQKACEHLMDGFGGKQTGGGQ